jgi:hypothetical protein
VFTKDFSIYHHKLSLSHKDRSTKIRLVLHVNRHWTKLSGTDKTFGQIQRSHSQNFFCSEVLSWTFPDFLAELGHEKMRYWSTRFIQVVCAKTASPVFQLQGDIVPLPFQTTCHVHPPIQALLCTFESEFDISAQVKS